MQKKVYNAKDEDLRVHNNVDSRAAVKEYEHGHNMYLLNVRMRTEKHNSAGGHQLHSPQSPEKARQGKSSGRYIVPI